MSFSRFALPFLLMTSGLAAPCAALLPALGNLPGASVQRASVLECGDEQSEVTALASAPTSVPARPILAELKSESGDSAASVAALQNLADWWSLRPLRRPPVPNSTGLDAEWIRNPIDAFIATILRERGLAPSPEADRRTLIRRVSFDLIGLPPNPQEIDAFVNDSAPNAYETLVDRLLASAQYGERWARHWLDVVHFGETHGYDKDKPRPNAWPYRDYVIRAFNQDKPYGRFVQEQIAGDVLFADADGIEATGFIAAGPWDLIGHMEVPEDKIDGKIARHLDRDDMVANTMNTFVSLTVQCAQCHDHKFDPISQEDYYSLQAVFAALDRADRKYHLDPALTQQRASLEARQRDLTERKKSLDAKITKLAGPELADLDKEIAATGKAPNDPNAQTRAGDLVKLKGARQALLDQVTDTRTKEELLALSAASADTEAAIARLPEPQLIFAGAVYHGSGAFRGRGPDGGKPRTIQVLSRGDVRMPGREVGPGALHAVAALPARFEIHGQEEEGARRVALARWVADPRNPLTWRSIVNRIWLYHFGRGIVDTPNDFGRMGQLPTHPELLDWLAAEFRDGGQSLKRLHHLVVTSATYRQSSAANEAFAKIDAGNAYYWRMNRRRLEAEAIRDSALFVSGKLNQRLGGPSFQDFVIEKPEHSPHYQYHLFDPEDSRAHRRSIYRFIVRSQPQPFMTTLDCADPSMQVDKRNETLSALQALALLNNGFMMTMAKHFAARVEGAGGDLAAKMERAFRLALGRRPTAEEQKELIAFTEQHGLANTCRAILNLNEFVFVD